MRIKVIYCTDAVYDEYNDQMRYAVSQSIQWEEIDDKKLEELRNTIYQANRSKRVKSKGGKYILFIDECDENYGELYKDAESFIKEFKMREQREKEAEKKRKAATKKATETRKRKQLEKLKKELGET